MGRALKNDTVFSGVLLAVASAIAFGVTIPAVSWAGRGVGAYSTAALLYLGAGAAALFQKALVRDAGSRLRSGAVPLLAVMVVSGAALAPTLFAWGLQRTGPVTGGLLLNFEAAWTVVLARVFFRESLGGRVTAAVALMVGGGVLLSSGRGQGVVSLDPLGALAVVGATLAWAIDNTVSRRLAELRPLTVVALKGALGGALTLGLALVMGDARPDGWQVAVLLAAGATGYGASVRLYLLAQRKIGAARTASVFALAPFFGAAVGAVIDPSALAWATLPSALLFATGVALHLSERHAHAHRHPAEVHQHAHRHDDGHHSHVHSEPVVGEHSHPHAHEPLEHSHAHGADVHHGHAH